MVALSLMSTLLFSFTLAVAHLDCDYDFSVDRQEKTCCMNKHLDIMNIYLMLEPSPGVSPWQLGGRDNPNPPFHYTSKARVYL